MRKSCITAIACCVIAIVAFSLPIHAQVGVFGGVPSPDLNRGFVRRIELKGTNTLGQSTTVTVPLNGILNYLFYFDPINGGASNEYFLLEGTYSIKFLDANGNPVTPNTQPFDPAPFTGPFNYVPNSGFTNGFQVAPTNPGAGGALGIQGFVKDRNGNPIFNAVVQIFPQTGPGISTTTTRTNGNGFYSFYYTNTANKDFIPAGTYSITASKLLSAGCTKTDTQGSFVYNPSNTTNPSNASYFVTNARTVIPDFTLDSSCP